MLNTTDTQLLELIKGDVVSFDIVSEEGHVDITLQKGDEESAYAGTYIPTSTFLVEINDSGTYTVSVIGVKAKGRVSVIKLDNE